MANGTSKPGGEGERELYGAATLRDLPVSDVRPVSAEALGPTLPGTPSPGPGSADRARPASGPGLVDPSVAALEEMGFGGRYEVGDLLGEGGMGQVRVCADQRIGRRVAMKVIRAGQGSRSDARARFVREARVQGQLEHPSIVPVYDVGLTPEGAAYFTMKRVRGVTLAEVVDGLRARRAEMAQRYSRRRLLTAFSNVCLTVHFAHTRGVLHRDLKPGNVMLGDFGEVYVLDWGLAKIAGLAEEESAGEARARPAHASAGPHTERVKDSPTDDSAQTVDGELMGTPGYMAPEQLAGPASALDARADVYALGAMLFELLALEPLHTRADVPGLVASTIHGASARPSVRAPERDVPPELEAMCIRATALEPRDRYASAGELHEALERYLDGDRDLALRREIAAKQAATAEEAATRALAEDGPDSHAERREAMHAVSRALALDPANKSAVATLVKLLTAPPRELPAQAVEEMGRSELEARRESSRLGAVTYAAFLIFVPFVLWMGIRDWVAAWIAGGLVLANAVAGMLLARSSRHGPGMHLAILTLSTAALGVSSLMFGPFVLLPAIVAANTMSYAMHPARIPLWATIGIGSMAFLVPLGLEWAGLLAPSYEIVGGAIRILPRIVSFPKEATLTYLVLTTLAAIVVPAIYAARFHAKLAQIERRLHLHAWQLRQLVPDEASDAARPPEAEPPAPACPIDELGRAISGAAGRV